MMSFPPGFEETPAFLELPALAPPDGIIPNFTNPSNLRAPELAVLQLTVATIAVVVRLCTKKFIVKRMFAEDCMLNMKPRRMINSLDILTKTGWLLTAWICFVCFHVNVFITEDLPLGVHQWDMTIGAAMRQQKIFHISTAVYAMVMLPLKVAIILQIRRIVLPQEISKLTPSHSRVTLRYVIDLFLGLNVAFYIGMIIFQLVTCVPLKKVWDFRIPGHCVSHHYLVHVVSGAINTAGDLITMALPQPVVWGLHLARRKKMGLSAVFLLGGLACMASCLRLYYAVLLSKATDQTYAAALMSKCVEPELMFGFLACCAPILPAFIRGVSRTTPGRKLRGMLTSSPLSQTERTNTGERSKDANVSRGTIMKKVEVDVELAQLTKSETKGGSRSSSFNTSNMTIAEDLGRQAHRQEWSSSVGLQKTRPAHLV